MKVSQRYRLSVEDLRAWRKELDVMKRGDPNTGPEGMCLDYGMMRGFGLEFPSEVDAFFEAVIDEDIYQADSILCTLEERFGL